MFENPRLENALSREVFKNVWSDPKTAEQIDAVFAKIDSDFTNKSPTELAKEILKLLPESLQSENITRELEKIFATFQNFDGSLYDTVSANGKSTLKIGNLKTNLDDAGFLKGASTEMCLAKAEHQTDLGPKIKLKTLCAEAKAGVASLGATAQGITFGVESKIVSLGKCDIVAEAEVSLAGIGRSLQIVNTEVSGKVGVGKFGFGGKLRLDCDQEI